MFTVRALISGKYSVNFIQIHRLVITKDGTVYIRLQLFHDPKRSKHYMAPASFVYSYCTYIFTDSDRSSVPSVQ